MQQRDITFTLLSILLISLLLSLYEHSLFLLLYFFHMHEIVVSPMQKQSKSNVSCLQGSSIESNENVFDDMKQLITVSVSKFINQFLMDMHDLQDNEKEDENKSSLPWASFNFINSIIGSGVIGKCCNNLGGLVWVLQGIIERGMLVCTPTQPTPATGYK